MPRTELALFAEAFARVLAPLEARLKEARTRLGGLEDDEGSLAAATSTLGELESELTQLAERVQAERATVFLFGPPKGGKSLLASTLSGLPPEGVTSFPAYPCVQHLAHGPAGHGLERFDGRLEVCADAASLELALAQGHVELSEAVRDAAARGAPFEPAAALRDAVRRVRRTRPSPALGDTAIQLCECPSVHGPLFADHAAMLVGEPDGARVALFVLRPAQLLDEASFDGLEELLGAFDVLFLVLNVDGRALELDSAGQLVAAAEREDPARLLDAVRKATTSVVLFEALRTGRVRVLALDLLEGARARLAGEEESAPGRRARFSDLERELCGALDRHETRAGFVESVVRHARELVLELRGAEGWSAFGPLGARFAAARVEREALERRLAALEVLGTRESSLWAGEPFFVQLRQALARSAAARAEERVLALAAPFNAALEDWFASDESLQELCDLRLAPRLAAAARELAAAQLAELAPFLDAAGAGAFSAAVGAELAAAGLASHALLAAPARLTTPMPVLPRPLDVAAIHVQKSLAQRLTLRSDDEVRRALFGPDEAPARRIDSRTKVERLGRELVGSLRDAALERARTAFVEAARASAEALVEAVLAGFRATLTAQLARARAAISAPLATARAREEALALALAALRALWHAEVRASGELAELLERFTRAGMLTPAPRRAPSATLRAGELVPVEQE